MRVNVREYARIRRLLRALVSITPEDMAINAGRVRVCTGLFAALVVPGCLDANPAFNPQKPTASDSSGETTQATAAAPTTATLPGGPTTSEPTTSGPTTTGSTTSGPTSDPVTTGLATTGEPATDTSDTGPGSTTAVATTSTASSSTGGEPVCGDGVPEGGEECDEGPLNDDGGACTTSCTAAVCGDGLHYLLEEECDDGNDVPTDGCIDCQLPRSCKEIQDKVPGAPSGQYFIDTDGLGPTAEIPVFCDMDTDGGGWTLVERSPLADPIGFALYKDHPVDMGQPLMPRYRAPKGVMKALTSFLLEAYIGCGPDDHLKTLSANILAGDIPNAPCSNDGQVFYMEAVFKGVKLMNVDLCTSFMGTGDGECPGAWSIREDNQYLCGLDDFPWSDMEPIASEFADLFATDPSTADEAMNPNVHACHKPGAIRVVMLR